MKKILSIEKYYDQTRFDYRYVWNSRNTLALHFGYYDETANKHFDAVANMNRVLSALARIQAGARVLDAGCGVGGSCIWLAQQRGADCIGVSLVESHLKDAIKNVKKVNLSEKISFLKADFCHIPVPDESVDVVWAIESQCHAIDKADFYKEAYRLLKKGGRLVIADYIRVKRTFDTEGEEALLKSWLNRWAIQDIDTETEHQRNAAQRGFVHFSIRNINPHVRRSLLNVYEQSKKWIIPARFLHKWGMVSSVRIDNALGAIHQYKAWDSGLWYYGLILCEK